MQQKEFRKVLKKYKNGLCSPEEEALVEKWFESMGASARPALDPSEKITMKERLWTRVQHHMMLSREQRPFRPVNTFTVWAVAAAVTLLIVSAVFLIIKPRRGMDGGPDFASARRIISNTTAGVMDVSLTDGSHVFLEPNSKLSFSNLFTSSNRMVELEGEALFSVSRDSLRPFLVTTKDLITKVLGTTFSVSAFPNEENVTVAVMTGKVSVTPRRHLRANDPIAETILTPNQKIVYSKNTNVVSRSIVSDPLPIVPEDVVKRMHFEAAPIKEIFEALEEVYGVDITFDADIFSSCILTTSIADGSIYERLDMICKAIDAQYFLKRNQIVITGAGCGK